MIFSICTSKGGTGKTTTALNLSHCLAKKGYKVLAVDLDGQCNLTQCFGLLGDIEQNIFTLMNDVHNKRPPQLDETIFKIKDNLHLIASHKNMSGAEGAFIMNDNRNRLLKKVLKPVSDKYDAIILDCSPSFSLATKNAITASRWAIIPTLAEYLPVKGVSLFIQRLEEFADDTDLGKFNIGGILFTQYNEKNRAILSKQLYEALKGDLKDLVFNTTIRRNIAISEAQARRQGIFEYAPDSNGAIDYEAFTDEFLKTFAS